MPTKLPYIDSISNMKHHYTSFLEKLDQGPIVLTQHGQAVAVLVSPEEWDAAAEEQAKMQSEMDMLRKKLEKLPAN